MEKKIMTIPVSEEGNEGIFLRIDEKLLSDAGFRRGEVMSVKINDGRIEIERGRETPLIEQVTDNQVRQMSYYDGSYKGYEVRLKLERHGEYAPRRISNAYDAYDLLRPLQYEPREKVLSMMLDSSSKLVGVYEAATGSIDRALLSPYELFQAAYLANSNRIILAHNHPSGDTKPSSCDCDITDRIKQAGEMMNIRLLDHIIVGDGKYSSFQENGYL